MSETASLPAPGQIARIRQRTYLVEDVVKPKRVADSTLVRLSCVDDDMRVSPGHELRGSRGHNRPW